MEPISEGKQLIDSWVNAGKELKRVNSSVNGAECALSNARNALGKWLTPDDAKPGEKFSIWYGDSLIEVAVTDGDPELRVRTRGKSLR